MRERDVLWILDALKGAGIPCVIGGGWGVDALVGHQTRRHHDLDLVLLEFERDEPRARAILIPLGFGQLSRSHASTRWMPSRSVMDDGAGRCIDLVSLEAAQLASMLGHREPVGDLSSDDGNSSLFVSGIVGGRLVACLSAEAQLLLHTRFDLRTHHKRDVRLLRNTLCARHVPRASVGLGVRGRRDSRAEDGAATEPSRPSP
jgi:lincosamide nucleotidyltransferase A/C/D/E